ncbi:MAG: hypothetical protein ACOYMZ_02115 [Minisyncoccia bacterium]
MKENFEGSIAGTESQAGSYPYFEGTASSKEFIAGKKFVEKFLKDVPEDISLLDTPEAIEVFTTYIEPLMKRLHPAAALEGTVEELKKAGVFLAPSIEEKIKAPKQPEFLETQYVNLEKPKVVEMDERELQILEANLLLEEMEKANVFKNASELEAVYTKSSEMGNTILENEEYYLQFAHLVKGGVTEIQEDMRLLAERKKQFEDKLIDMTPKEKGRLESAKKVATITERALVYYVSILACYGKEVSVTSASEFDDVKRGVDDIFQIEREDDISTFLGLAIDATFRGLYSEQFKNKFTGLLASIYEGYKTKVKYHKNHQNELMKEFAIPKMVLSFNMNDVRELIEMLKQADSPDMEEKFKNSPQKFNILNQVMNSCAILAEFAQECNNSISKEYKAVADSIKELAAKNPDVQEVLDAGQDDEVSKHLKMLIDEFRFNKKGEKKEQQRAA